MYPGAVVRVHGLSSRSDLNGCEAEVLDSVSGGRCGVRIVASGEQVRVRPANLREQHSGPDDIRLTDADGIVYGSDEFMQNNRVPDFAALLYAEAAEQGLDVSRLDVKVPSLLPPPYFKSLNCGSFLGRPLRHRPRHSSRESEAVPQAHKSGVADQPHHPRHEGPGAGRAGWAMAPTLEGGE